MRRPEQHGRRRRAFTLIEVVVALTVGAMILLAARQLVVQLGETTHATVRAAARIDAEANGDHIVRALAARLEIGTPDAVAFDGDERQARFSSWCDVPGGWQERCVVTLAVGDAAPGDSGRQLVLTQSTAEPMVLRRGLRGAMLAYLGSAGGGGQWLTGWSTAASAPLAIGVLLEMGTSRDTLVLRVGRRD